MKLKEFIRGFVTGLAGWEGTADFPLPVQWWLVHKTKANNNQCSNAKHVLDDSEMHCSSMLSQIPSLTEQRGSSTQCAATLILFTPRGISCQKICFSPKCTTLPALVCWVAFIGRVVERGQNYSKFSVKTTVAKQGGSEAAPPFESDFPKASASSCVHLPPLPQSLAGAFFRLFVLYSFIIFLVFDYSL